MADECFDVDRGGEAFFYSLRGAIAEYDGEKIRSRTMSGRLQRARSGKMPIGAAPYGYRYDQDKGSREEPACPIRTYRVRMGFRCTPNGKSRSTGMPRSWSSARFSPRRRLTLQ